MSQELSPTRQILQLYLSQYSPWDGSAATPPHPIYKTSEDIVRDLSDMIDIDVNTVASAMIANGYSMALTAEHRGWELMPVRRMS